MDNSLPIKDRLRAKPKPVFLSSLSGDLESLRKQLHTACKNALWVSEIDDKYLHLYPKLEIADECVEILVSSDLMICILAGENNVTPRAGTPIDVADDIKSPVTYFEIEIIQAVLNKIPVLVYERNDFKPNPRLKQFIDVLRSSKIALDDVRNLTTEELVSLVKAATEKETWLNEVNKRDQILTQQLAIELIGDNSVKVSENAALKKLSWFGGARITECAVRKGTLIKAKNIFAISENESHHRKKLTRLYLTSAELMYLSSIEDSEGESRFLWNDLLRSWSNSAAWHDVHNHLSMGMLATLCSQKLLREKTPIISNIIDEFSLEMNLASAYFSLSKKLNNKLQQKRILHFGAKMANRASAIKDPFRKSSIHAVRASIFLLKRNPKVIIECLKLYFYSKHPKENFNKAEALVYVGCAYTKLGNLKFLNRVAKLLNLAGKILEKSVNILTYLVITGEVGPEFLIKAKKHYMVLLFRNNLSAEANGQFEEAMKLCEKYGVLDQARQLIKIRREEEKRNNVIAKL